ncbi:MAG: hypothetical protein HYT28_03420 [Parcubacteria group bacterium]|nr:hypothetical protein [Parcubacteria group bacterium]
MLENNEQQNRADCGKHVFIFLLGFAVGFGSFWLWDKNNTDSADKNLDESKEISASAEEDGSNGANPKERNRVVVVSQEAGSLVVVTEVEVEAPTWVAIHEDVDGKPANILGAQLFDAGIHSGTVALLRNTEPGNTYHAFLYKDNGDRAFDYVIDLPVEGVSETVVSSSFVAVSPSVPL